MLTNKTVHVCNKSANIEFACQPNERDARAAESYVITSLMLLTCARLRNSVNSTGQHQQHANQTKKTAAHVSSISESFRFQCARKCYEAAAAETQTCPLRACLCVNGVTPARAYNITTTQQTHTHNFSTCVMWILLCIYMHLIYICIWTKIDTGPLCLKQSGLCNTQFYAKLWLWSQSHYNSAYAWTLNRLHIQTTVAGSYVPTTQAQTD